MTIWAVFLLLSAVAGIAIVAAATALSARYLGLMRKELFRAVIIFQLLSLALFLISILGLYSIYPIVLNSLFALLEVLYTSLLFFKYVRSQLCVPAAFIQAALLAIVLYSVAPVAVAISFFFAVFSTISVSIRNEGERSYPFIILSFLILDFSLAVQGLDQFISLDVRWLSVALLALSAALFQFPVFSLMRGRDAEL
jgi:hypothetical protein